MSRKVLSLLIVVVCVIVLGGCNSEMQYDFSDEAIIAYYDKIQIYEQDLEIYIAFETKIRQYVLNVSDFDEIYNSDYTKIEKIENLEKCYQYLDRTYKYLRYTPEEKERDYFKLLIRVNEIEQYNEYADSVNALADGAVTRILDKPQSSSDLWNLEMDISSIIEAVSIDYDITYEQCAKTVYKQFYKNSIYLLEVPPNYRKKEYSGEQKEMPGLEIARSDMDEYNTLVKEYYYYTYDVQCEYDEYLEKEIDEKLIKR